MDFDGVFALVARLESVRVLITLAVHEQWVMHHMDIKSTFPNGTIKEEVYIHQPPGFIVARSEEKVLHPNKGVVRPTSSTHGMECQAQCHLNVGWFSEEQLEAWSLHSVP
jgi:hypothetical protein